MEAEGGLKASRRLHPAPRTAAGSSCSVTQPRRCAAGPAEGAAGLPGEQQPRRAGGRRASPIAASFSAASRTPPTLHPSTTRKKKAAEWGVASGRCAPHRASRSPRDAPCARRRPPGAERSRRGAHPAAAHRRARHVPKSANSERRSARGTEAAGPCRGAALRELGRPHSAQRRCQGPGVDLVTR